MKNNIIDVETNIGELEIPGKWTLQWDFGKRKINLEEYLDILYNNMKSENYSELFSNLIYYVEINLKSYKRYAFPAGSFLYNELLSDLKVSSELYSILNVGDFVHSSALIDGYEDNFMKEFASLLDGNLLFFITIKKVKKRVSKGYIVSISLSCTNQDEYIITDWIKGYN